MLKGPLGSFLYPLVSPLVYLKKEKKLFFSNDTLLKKSLKKLSHLILIQSSLGVLIGYRCQLNIVGIGYQASIEKLDNLSILVLKLGFSHQIKINIPKYLEISCPKPRIIVIKGINLQKIKNFAAMIRKLKLPSAYKEKGIYFLNERLKLKQGKKT
jgi:large subunit ribosomal protein L6